MRDVVHGRIFLAAFLLFAAFAPVCFFAVPIDNLFAFTGGLNIVSGPVTFMAYWPALRLAIKLPPRDRQNEDLLTLAIMMFVFAEGGRILYVTVKRQFGDTVTSDYVLAFFQWCIFCASIWALSARKVIRQGIPESSWQRVALTIAGGFILGVILALTN